MGAGYKSLSKKLVIQPPVNLPEIPERPYDFEPLTLTLRQEGDNFTIEAFGPYGGRLEAQTKMPEESNDTEAMGEALFPGKIKNFYQELLQKTEAANQGLRIQLDFRGEAKSYAIWPWEMMRLDGNYITANPRINISRTVTSDVQALPFGDTPKPYRLLLIMSCPDDLVERFDIKDALERDLEFIRKALETQERDGYIEITVLRGRDANIKNLKHVLEEQNHQALYIASHGGFGDKEQILSLMESKEKQDVFDWLKKGNDGLLIFDDGGGKSTPVFADDLIQALDGSSIRLVFFNTEHTAYGNSPEGAGIAENLLKAGIPAVVAFQDIVYTNWGSEFVGAFFQTLAKLNSLELALLAGREAIREHSTERGQENHWAYPILFTRFKEGEKVFSGEIGGKISAFVNAKGEVEIIEQQQNESDVTIFRRQINSLNGLLEGVEDIGVRNTVETNILNATRIFQRKNADEAIGLLTQSSMAAVASIKKQRAKKEQEVAKKKAKIELQEKIQIKREEAENKRRIKLRRKQTERIIILLIAGLMMLTVGVIAQYMNAEEEIGVLGLPIPVVLWSFIGGVGATLYAFVGTQKYEQTESLRIDWLIGRPIVGVIMGSVVFLAVATSLNAIGVEVPENLGEAPDDVADAANNAKAASKPYLLWALSFIGGFSDKFAILLFDNLVGKFTSARSQEVDEEQALVQEEEILEEEMLGEENREEAAEITEEATEEIVEDVEVQDTEGNNEMT